MPTLKKVHLRTRDSCVKLGLANHARPPPLGCRRVEPAAPSVNLLHIACHRYQTQSRGVCNQKLRVQCGRSVPHQVPQQSAAPTRPSSGSSTWGHQPLLPAVVQKQLVVFTIIYLFSVGESADPPVHWWGSLRVRPRNMIQTKWCPAPKGPVRRWE